MKSVILTGHTHKCPIHDPGTVTPGAANYLLKGKPVVRFDDETSYGVLITTGSPGYLIEGKCVAREGDRTNHDGTLVGGDHGWLLD